MSDPIDSLDAWHCHLNRCMSAGSLVMLILQRMSRLMNKQKEELDLSHSLAPLLQNMPELAEL